MHWPVDPQHMRELLAEQFELDLFDGQAWIGIVPFRMTGVRPRCLPALPGLVGEPNPSRFLELNVRTYVTVDDKPGVLFFSLDAESKLAVRAARRFFHLPYFDARMACARDDQGWFQYESLRTHTDALSASLRVRYRPEPDTLPASGKPGSLEYFLTERYCLYVLNRKGQPLRGDIHHAPWPLQVAEAEIQELDMTANLNLDLTEPPHCCHFAERLHVAAWLNSGT